MFDELDSIIVQQSNEGPSISHSSTQTSGPYAVAADDPATNWIPSINTKELTFSDTKLGHISPATYFGSNFSPMTAFTDDHDDSSPSIAPTNNEPGNTSDYALFSEKNVKSAKASRRSYSKSYDAVDTYPPTALESGAMWERRFQADSGRTGDTDTNEKDGKALYLGSSTFDDNTSITSDSGSFNGEPNTPSSVESSGRRRTPTSGKPRGRKSLHEAATAVLTDWILQHQDDPYPTQAEKESLALRGGVSVKQVVDWMTNMRKRRLHPVISGKRPPKSALDYMFLRNYRLRREREYLREKESLSLSNAKSHSSSSSTSANIRTGKSSMSYEGERYLSHHGSMSNEFSRREFAPSSHSGLYDPRLDSYAASNSNLYPSISSSQSTHHTLIPQTPSQPPFEMQLHSSTGSSGHSNLPHRSNPFYDQMYKDHRGSS